VLGILGFVGKGAAPLDGQLGEALAGVFFFPTFLGLIGHVTSRSSEKISPDVWLVSSIWFLLSSGQIAIGT
jgi:hypothetical protein